MVKIWVKRSDGIVQRYRIKSRKGYFKTGSFYRKTRANIWSKSKPVAKPMPKPVIRVEKKVPVEVAKVFRSLITTTTTNDGVPRGIEYRVWVHTEEPNLNSAVLEAKIDELRRLFPNGDEPLPVPADELNRELNEEKDKDMITPASADMGEFFGYIKFNSGYEYFARGKPFLVKSMRFEVAR